MSSSLNGCVSFVFSSSDSMRLMMAVSSASAIVLYRWMSVGRCSCRVVLSVSFPSSFASLSISSFSWRMGASWVMICWSVVRIRLWHKSV